MDMGFDHEAWPTEQAARAERGTDRAALDWHGLRARFMAVQACRTVLVRGGRSFAAAAGASFHRSAARALAQLGDASEGVNLIDLADGKRPSANKTTSPAHPGAVIEDEHD